jgi:hypothetical protein
MKIQDAINNTYLPKQTCKVVNYFGKNMLIDLEYNYIATDSKGLVIVFVEKPGFSKTTWSSKGKEEQVFDFQENIEDWKYTLAQITNKQA